MKILIAMMLSIAVIFPSFGSKPFVNQNFSMPDYFQVIQYIQNVSWQGLPVRIQMVQSSLTLEDLTKRLAMDVPQGALLSSKHGVLQFGWIENNISHLIELKSLSDQLVEGTYSEIQLNSQQVASVQFQASDDNFIATLIPKDSKVSFKFKDQSIGSNSVEIHAYQTILSASQLSKFITEKLDSRSWVISKRYTTSPYQNAWSSIEAVLDQQRLNIFILPDSIYANLLIMRTY